MKTTTEKLLGLLVMVVVIFGAAMFIKPTETRVIGIPNTENQLGASFDNINASCTYSNVIVSNSVVATATNEVLAENYAASYRRLQNVGNVQVSCVLDSSTSTLAVDKGITLNASTTNSTYVIDGDNLYQRAINCIAGSASGTIAVMECY